MYSPPDGFFTALISLAGIGILAALAGGRWLAYHLLRAVLFYVGVA